MKLKALLVSLTMCISVGAFSQGQKARPDINWFPIVGFKDQHVSAYIDTNSHTRTRSPDGDSDYSSAAILIIVTGGEVVEVDGKPIQTKSLVKHFLIDCNAGLLFPVYDFYFAVEKPTRADRPVGAHKYESIPPNYAPISKKSVVYQTICPDYI